jgi:hypothetical protein
MLQKPELRMRRKISWSCLAIAPILALVGFETILLLNGYNGHCGLLDAGWDCSKAEYVVSALFSPFLLPVFFIYSLGWLLLLSAAAVALRVYRRRHRAAT